MSFLNFLQTQTPNQTGGSITSLLFTIVMMVAIFYFFLIRPQKKQQKETKSMLDALKKGDKIVTIGGIRGVVFAVKDSTVVVKVDDNAKIEFTKEAISKVVNDDNSPKVQESVKEEKAPKTVKSAKTEKVEKVEKVEEKPTESKTKRTKKDLK